MFSINVQHMKDHAVYFGEALAICEDFDLLKLIQFNCDFDVSLVVQFLATVHFDTDDARTLTWMTKNEHFDAPWREFSLVLGYDDMGIHDRMGFRPHDRATTSDKDVLADLYIAGRGVMGESKDLLPTYDIMHCIYRNVLNPKVAN